MDRVNGAVYTLRPVPILFFRLTPPLPRSLCFIFFPLDLTNTQRKSGRGGRVTPRGICRDSPTLRFGSMLLRSGQKTQTRIVWCLRGKHIHTLLYSARAVLKCVNASFDKRAFAQSITSTPLEKAATPHPEASKICANVVATHKGCGLTPRPPQKPSW